MVLYVKNKFASLAANSNVIDENENPVYKVKGRVLSPTKVKKIYDMDGNFLYKVRCKFFHLFMNSCYIYDSNNNKICRIKQKFGLHQRFFVMGYKDEIRIDGDWIALDLDIYKNEKLIGQIHRKFFALTDQFELTTDEDEEAPFLVALIIGMDNIYDKNQNTHS